MHKKTIEFLKRHSEALRGNDRNVYISDDMIPPLPAWLEGKRNSGGKKEAWALRYRLALTVCAAIIIFFVATPPGHSLAESIYGIIVDWYETSVHMNISDPYSEEDDILNEKFEKGQESATLYSYEELEAVYDGEYYYIPGRKLKLITFESTPTGESIVLVYEDDFGELAVSNETNADGFGAAIGMKNENEEVIENYRLYDGTEMNGFYDHIENEGSVMGANENHLIGLMGKVAGMEDFYEFLDSVEKNGEG